MTKLRENALREIATFYERPIECMPDIKPVKEGECRGPLEIDHRFGGGKRDAGYQLYKDIVEGERDLTYFRVLCRYHNRVRTNDFGKVKE